MKRPNAWDIPELTAEREVKRPPRPSWPAIVWGSVPRSTFAGTWFFYTDDYRFEGVWADPSRLIRTRCAGAAECNFSVFDDSPRAVALWSVYRKRWLAREWQRAGVRVWVDVCFAHRHRDVCLLGVPRGWQRFATAGFERRIGDLDFELRQVRRYADGASFTLLVYGGGSGVHAWCERHAADVIHIPHWSRGRSRPGEHTRLAALRDHG